MPDKGLPGLRIGNELLANIFDPARPLSNDGHVFAELLIPIWHRMSVPTIVKVEVHDIDQLEVPQQFNCRAGWSPDPTREARPSESVPIASIVSACRRFRGQRQSATYR